MRARYWFTQWGVVGLVMFGVGLGLVVALAFIAPRQADAREQVDRSHHPSTLVTCQGALHMTRALAGRLEDVVEIERQKVQP